MTTRTFTCFLVLFHTALLCAQNVGINATGAAPDGSALLDVAGTSGGLLIPRLTTAQRNAIGTPATSLLVFNTATARFEYFDGSVWQPLLSGVNAGWELSGNAGTNPATQFLGTTDAQAMTFRTANTERMRISATGSVGINTAAPASTLHVRFTPPTNNINGMLRLEAAQAGSAANVLFQNSITTNMASLGMLANGDFGLHMGCNFGGCIFGVEAFRVKPDGDLGIGTTTPDRHAEIEGQDAQFLRVTTNTPTSVAGLEFKRLGASSLDWQIRNESGVLRFGVSANDLLTVSDELALTGTYLAPAVDNGLSCGLSILRFTEVFATSGVVNTSDARDKTDIQDLDRGLREVLRLRPVSFTWKDRPEEGTKLGLIAQELQQVLPEVVRDRDRGTAPDGTRAHVEAERLGVYYSDLIPVLVKAIQEQEARIDALQAELEAIRER